MSTRYNEKKVAEILDVAYDLFVEQGYEQTSISQIATAVNISKSGLFYYFSDKQTILIAILQRKTEIINIILRTALSHENAIERLIDVLIDLLFEQKQEIQFYNNVFSNLQLMKSITEERKMTVEYRMKILNEAFTKQGIEQPKLAAMTLMSMLDGFGKIISNELYEIKEEELRSYIKSLYHIKK